MQELGRRYVAFFNYTMDRTGTLWEGRYKSCLVDSEMYVLQCYRYIELNPVRAAIVSRPENFPWSSFRSNGLGDGEGLVTPHPAYLSMGTGDSERRLAYREFVETACDPKEADEIRAMTSRQRAFGSRSFKATLEAVHHRPMGLVHRGRPKREREAE
jgi:putative transposase